MSVVRDLRFVLRELTAAAEAVRKHAGPPAHCVPFWSELDVALLKARCELDKLTNAGKPTPAKDPIDDITPEDVLGQIGRVAAARSGTGQGFPPALLCQSEEARTETRGAGEKAVEIYRDHERYLRTLRLEKQNPRAFFFEG